MYGIKHHIISLKCEIDRNWKAVVINANSKMWIKRWKSEYNWTESETWNENSSLKTDYTMPIIVIEHSLCTHEIFTLKQEYMCEREMFRVYRTNWISEEHILSHFFRIIYVVNIFSDKQTKKNAEKCAHKTFNLWKVMRLIRMNLTQLYKWFNFYWYSQTSSASGFVLTMNALATISNQSWRRYCWPHFTD